MKVIFIYLMRFFVNIIEFVDRVVNFFQMII